MASGERITVTYRRPLDGQGEGLKMDVYAFVPPVDPIDPNPTFSTRNRLPFILFVHGGHFLTGSRRDIPPWLASLARDHGMPLLAVDYRLAPHAGPSHSFDDLKHAWQFIVNDLNWIIACAGNGAEVESGNEMLEDDFSELQRRGGIDIDRGIVVGVGAGGYLAALGGAVFTPPPLALVLGYPQLEIANVSPDSYFVGANTPGHLRPLLNPDNVGQVGLAKHSVPDMPMVLDKAPYALEMRSRCGMDAGERWKGKEESVQRQGVTEFLLKNDRLDALLRKASPDLITPEQLLLNSDGKQGDINQPYPPTLIFHGLRDSRVSPESSRRFIDVIRTVEPVAAAIDTLAQGGSGRLSSSLHSASTSAPQTLRSAAQRGGEEKIATDEDSVDDGFVFRCVPREPNVTNRYLLLGIDGPTADHGFDALLPRELRQTPFSRQSPKTIADRYRASLIHVERFIRHWLLEGSAERAAAQKYSQSTDRTQGKSSFDVGGDDGDNKRGLSDGHRPAGRKSKL